MRYAGFNPEDMADCLDGFCCSFWTQGCPFHCKGCHNPESWDFNGGEELIEEDYNKMLSYFGKTIHKDFSILGGEPLANREIIKFLDKMVKDVKNIDNTVKVYLWTGFTLEEIIENSKEDKFLESLMNQVTYLVDGRFEIDKKPIRNLVLRGSTNQKIHKNIGDNENFNFIDITETLDKERNSLN